MISICSACGTSYQSAPSPPEQCTICNDERQFVPTMGQRWVTPDNLNCSHATMWRQHAPGLLSLQTQPKFAIGQRAFLLATPAGNILWDCVACLDPATVTLVHRLGGIRAIAISHPHYYTTMQDWAAAFDAPVYLHADDHHWVMRDSPHIAFWQGETLALAPGLTIVRLGGHFPGGSILHWSGEGGVVLASDIVQVSPGADRVSFMWSYPNLLPLPPRTVKDIHARLDALAFNRLLGAFEGQDITRGAKAIVAKSAARYVACLT